jgi:hypothetical protein
LTATVSDRFRSVVEVTGKPFVSRRKSMEQMSGYCSSCSDGSDDGSNGSANYDGVVVPSPVLPSSHDSPELGVLPSASTPHVSGFDEDPPGMVSSSGSESDEEVHNDRARRAAQASSDARAAAVHARRNIRRGFANDSDEQNDSRASASRRASRAELYGSDDCYHPPSKKRREEDSSVEEDMDSDDEEDTNTSQASSRTPRKIKTQWREIKVYDRSKMHEEAIKNDIDQIMRDSLRDANFHPENVESYRPSDRGYFKLTHVSSFICPRRFHFQSM